MKVTFVVADFLNAPTGGMKVAYQLANGLSDQGHDVSVLHVDTLVGQPNSRRLRRDVRFALWKRGFGGWFRLDSDVETGLIGEGHPESLPDGDAIVACGWRVVDFVEAAPLRAGRKLYFAQGYMADAEGSPGEVDAVWRRPMPKIVIASWLEKKAREISGPNVSVALIRNAIDQSTFSVRVDPAERPPASVAMIDHASPLKGVADGLAALEIVRREQPDLRLALFGTDGVRPTLPSWATYVRQPRDLAALYNSAAIFVHPSRLEGWPLTPAEAMACGCALAAFANDGVSEYAVDGRNALLVPVGDVDGLAAAVTKLIQDRDLRLVLARQGSADMATYTWERSVSEFERALTAVS